MKTQKPIVILLHGLHMHAWSMKPLANYLNSQQFSSYCFGYYSMLQDLPTHSKRLNDWLLKHFSPDTPLLLVGHSLGGLVIRDFLARYPNWQVTRCVTLGTPHNGSLSADTTMKLIPTFIGRSYVAGLDGTVAKLREGVALGSIAGNLSAGLGKLVLPKHPVKKYLSNNPYFESDENDGTVFVYETWFDEMTDHCILRTYHTGMLINQEVAEQVAYFLKNGQFKK